MSSVGYVDFVEQSYHYMLDSARFLWRGQYSSANFSRDASILVQQVSLADLLVVTVLSIGLTFARHYATKHILQVSQR